MRYTRINSSTGETIAVYEGDCDGILGCCERGYSQSEEDEVIAAPAFWQDQDGNLITEPGLLEELEKTWDMDAREED